MKNNDQKPVKIIQILQDHDPDVVKNLYGLGDDGVVYCSNWAGEKWDVLVPRPSDPIIETGGDNE
jgi:hypothetical protein